MRAAEKKHAILILAHEDPGGLSRLVTRLEHPRIHIFVHLDRSTKEHFRLDILSNQGATVISTRKVNWGGMSSCHAQLDLVRTALEENSFETFTLISGRDHPVKRIGDIVADLDALDVNLIEHWHHEDPSWHSRYKRMFFYDSLAARPLNAISRRVAPYLPDRKSPDDLKVYFGWAWWSLKRDGVDAVLRFCEERPDVVDWYRYVHIAEESFFQTALNNVSKKPCLSRSIRRFIRFPNASANPKIIDFDDLDECLNGNFWFARKFSEAAEPDMRHTVDKMLDAGADSRI